MTITAINNGDGRENFYEIISKDFYNGRMPYGGYRLIDICLKRYHYPMEDIYELFVTAKAQGLLFKFDFLEGVAEYRYQYSVPALLIIILSNV
jgi:hypothetical protein